MQSIPLRTEGVLARVIRSSAWTLMGFGAAQAVRLISNLILTRLLFPEAFGMMALVTVALIAVTSLSDIGLGPAISHNRRGDDPDFLDTAWTLQGIRGVLLFLGTCALAWPVARFYGEPMLTQLLPVAGIGLLIGAVMPMRVETANRHLLIGRLTVLDLTSSVIGTAAMVVLAYSTRSIWSLVFGSLIGSLAKLVLVSLFLPGRVNRLHWEPEARHELFHFGKWIFLSTITGFMVSQGDRVILGKFLSLAALGIYNVGYFLASFPLLLGGAIAARVLIPLYRETPPSASRENFEKIRLLRLALTGSIVCALLLMASVGIPLVNLLYDARFHAAGPIVVLLACMQIPTAIQLTYDQSALAAGDSRRYFMLMAPRALLLTVFVLVGVQYGGLIGALAGQGLATIAIYPLVARLARRFGAWDPLHDALYAAAGFGCGGYVLWLNRDSILALAYLG